MKRISLLVVAIMLFGFSLAHAETGTKLKVGLVDFQLALNDVKQGKTARDALKKDFDTKQKKLDLQQSELMKLKEEFEKQRLALSEEALRAKEKTLNEKFQNLQENLANFRKGLAEKEGKMMNSILGNLKLIVEEIGKDESFDLIVVKSQSPVLYAASEEDLTARVIKIYNKRYTGKL